MRNVAQRWKVRALAFVLVAVFYACLVPGEAYVGATYEPTGYEYGGWGPGYHVGPPPRGGERRPERPPQAPPRAYRPAPPSRPAPSIPTRPHGHSD